MNRKQFAVIAVFTAMETYFSMKRPWRVKCSLHVFGPLLILRNLQTAYMVEKIASAIEKEINRKKIKPLKRNPFSKVFLWL